PIVYLIIFKDGPMLGNIIAFRKFVPGGSLYGDYWVGLHYIKMFISDPTFYNVFKNTLIIISLTLIICFPAPIIFALLLHELKANCKFYRFVQTASYLPHFFSVVIVSGMILQLVAKNGAVNNIVEFFTGERISFIQKAEWFRT